MRLEQRGWVRRSPFAPNWKQEEAYECDERHFGIPRKLDGVCVCLMGAV